jgi:hypothetical protein
MLGENMLAFGQFKNNDEFVIHLSHNHPNHEKKATPQLAAENI